jgi:hypothetical protein
MQALCEKKVARKTFFDICWRYCPGQGEAAPHDSI